MTLQAERSGVTTTDDVRLHVETTGPEDAPVTVVLAHGWTCSTRSWHHQFAGLPAVLGPSRIRVVAYDHRGHGRSDAAPVGSTRIEKLAEDLVTVLDAVVPSGPIVYAGHSMGGMTLMALADQRPDLIGSRIVAAALVSTSAGQTTSRPLGLPARFDGVAAAFAPRAINLANARLERRELRRAARMTAEAGAGPAAAVQAVTAVEEAAAQAAEEAAAAKGARAAAGAQRAAMLKLAAERLRRPAVRQLCFGRKADPAEVDILMADLAATPARSFSGFFEAITRHDLGHALKVLDGIPVEIMHGTRDRLLPPRHANRLAQLLPSARLWMYPGAGHMLMQERPRDVTHRLASLARKAVL